MVARRDVGFADEKVLRRKSLGQHQDGVALVVFLADVGFLYLLGRDHVGGRLQRGRRSCPCDLHVGHGGDGIVLAERRM